MLMLMFLMLNVVSGVSTRVVTNTLYVSNGNGWGDWGNMEYCPDGTYAVGYDMQIEGWQGRDGDDTALNGIKLICQRRYGHTDRVGSVTSEVGPLGYWVGEAYCYNHVGEQHFLTSFSLQVEGLQYSGDDTAANSIKFKCRDLYGNIPSYVMYRRSGTWGEYGEWSDECPTGQAICGIKTMIEPPQGQGDDTALNDVVFYCCY